MDRKSILILIVCFVLLMLWVPLTTLLYPPLPAPATTNQVVTPRVPGPAGATNTANSPAPSLTMPSAPLLPLARPEAPEQLLTVETAGCRYTFSSHGGGIKQVELKEFTEVVTHRGKGPAPTNRHSTLNLNAATPILALLGSGALQTQTPYHFFQTGAWVRAEGQLGNGLQVVKDFQLGTNHVSVATVRVENNSDQPQGLPAIELVLGTATPAHRYDAGQFVGVQWYDGTTAQYVDQAWYANRTLGCLPGTPRAEYQSQGISNVVWAASHNQFFTLIALPRQPAPYLVARKVELPRPSQETLTNDPKAERSPVGYQAAFVHPAQVLGPRQHVEWTVELYAGPKEYNTLVALGKGREQAMRFTTFFGWFAKALLLSMNALHRVGLSYGLAIIGITIVIKLLFWPLTQASTRSMKRMQALQPQMKAIQEKYKDDPKKMNQKTMEFMRENKVNPMGACFPVMLQIPVFIGFYQMLQSAIELRGASFLWARDLSQPDTVAVILGFPLNPLPLIMGVTQYWQTRMTPPSPGMDPVQQKIFQYMPLIFIVILYNFPAGLALYWTVQNLLSILQMKLTKANVGPPGGGAPGAPSSPGKKK